MGEGPRWLSPSTVTVGPPSAPPEKTNPSPSHDMRTVLEKFTLAPSRIVAGTFFRRIWVAVEIRGGTTLFPSQPRKRLPRMGNVLRGFGSVGSVFQKGDQMHHRLLGGADTQEEKGKTVVRARRRGILL